MAYDLGVLEAEVTLNESKFQNKLKGLESKGQKSLGKVGNAADGLSGKLISAGKNAGGMFSTIAMGALKVLGPVGIAAAAVVGLGYALKKAYDAARYFVEIFAVQEDAERSLLTALRYTDTAISKNRKNAAEYAKQTVKLNSQLDKVAKARYNNVFSKQYNDLKNYASELQNATVHGDEFLMEQMAMGINMGISSDKIKEATKAAIGLAECYKMDVKTSMQIVARANHGQTSMLTRFGIVLDDSMNKQEKFNALLKMGAEGFKIAEEKAKTLGGRLQQQGNTWGDLKEEIGRFLGNLFRFKELSEWFRDLFGNIANYLKKNSPYWVHEIHRVYYETENVVKKTWALIEPVVTFTVEIFQAAVTNIVNALKWCFDNSAVIWQNFGKVADAVFEDFQQGFSAGFNFVITVVKSSLEAVMTIFTSMIANIGDILMDVFDLFARVVKTVVISFENAFKAILKLASATGENLWDLLLGRKTLSEALGGIKNVFNNEVKNMENPMETVWGDFDFRRGTKKFAADTAAATKKASREIAKAGIDGLAGVGRNTERVMGEIGATPFPELQGPDYGALRDKYKNMGKRFAEIDKETEAKLKENDKRLKKMLSDKVDGGNSMGQAKEAEKRQTPVGSFSVALLAAMTGAQSPAERTAKAMEHMERDIKKMRLGGKSFFYS